MPSTRRRFLGTAAAAGAALAASAALPAWSCASGPRRSGSLRILILGGTGFIGPKTVETALARGHQVTVFNRGRTEKRIPFGFEGVEHLYGNRDPKLRADDADPASPLGLTQLEGRKWDAVIDNSGYYPRHVAASAELLAPNAGQYLFISSISAYADNSIAGQDETAVLAELADPTVETMGQGGEYYGGLKVLCERAAASAFAGRATIVRPGFIVGPGDPTDRFTYWPVRAQRGGEMLAPGTPEDAVQWIDVRDLAEWLVRAVEERVTGDFNLCGDSARWGALLRACAARGPAGTELTWVDAEWLQQNAQDVGFPIWIPPVPEAVGFHTWSNARAKAAGLKLRSMEETLRATLAWWPDEVARRRRVGEEMRAEAAAKGQPEPQLPDPETWRAGPPLAREAEVLAAWKARAEAGAAAAGR